MTKSRGWNSAILIRKIVSSIYLSKKKKDLKEMKKLEKEQEAQVRKNGNDQLIAVDRTVLPQNLYVAALTPSVAISKDKVLGRKVKMRS